MKILIIGFLVFSGWSTLSSYIYVCKIKGLCDEKTTMQISAVEHNAIVTNNTMHKTLPVNQAVIPENLVIYFAFDNSGFNPDSGTDKYFDVSKAFLDQNPHARLNITGYTDAVGSDEYNQDLGYRRALRMKNYFEGKGMISDKIIMESKGEKEPANNNNTADGRAKNRRTEIIIKK